MEQTAEAALDVRALELAFTIVQEVREKFPNAQRTVRLTVSTTSSLTVCKLRSYLRGSKAFQGA